MSLIGSIHLSELTTEHILKVMERYESIKYNKYTSGAVG